MNPGLDARVLEHFPKFIYKKKYLYHPLGIESQLILTGCLGSSAKIVRQRLRRDIWKLGPIVFTRHSSCQYRGKRWSHVLNQHDFPMKSRKISLSRSPSRISLNTHRHREVVSGAKVTVFWKIVYGRWKRHTRCIFRRMYRADGQTTVFFSLLLFFFLFFFYYQSIAHRNIRYRDRFAFWFKNNLFSSECGTYIARASKRQARYLVKIYFLVFIANNTTSVFFFFFLPFFYKRYLHNYISVSVPR